VQLCTTTQQAAEQQQQHNTTPGTGDEGLLRTKVAAEENV
jgi:hypothetical protein